MKKRKILAVLLAITTATGLLAGCGQNKISDETDKQVSVDKQKIVVATNRTDIVDTKLKQMADQFMVDHPDIEVVFEAVKDYDSTIRVRVAGGEAPDIYQVMENISQDVLPDYFLPVDDLGFSEDNLYYYNGNLNADGKVYALNDAISYEGIVYNKKAFEKAGITEVPKTTEDFFAACEKLKKADIVPMTTALKDVWPIYPWVTWDSVQIVMNGDQNGKNVYLNKDAIYDDVMIKSFDIIRECYKQGYLEPDVMSAGWDQLKLDMAQGKAAMHYTGSWFPIQLVELGAAEGDIGMFPFPDAKGVSVVKGKSWGVSKDSKSPDAAKTFLKYMIEGGRYSTITGDTPANKDVTSDSEVIKELLGYGVPTIASVSADPKFTTVVNDIECNPQVFLQMYITEPDDQKVAELVAEWNQKWSEGLKK
jgi:raffinose/stachyose/melibiose transport system substrate-binding protein